VSRTLFDRPVALELDGNGPPSTGPAEGGGRRWPSRPRPVVVLAVAAALVASAGVGAVLASARSGSPGGADGTRATPTSSATVTRQDLVSRTEVAGTLGYAGEVKALNQLQGTVTAVPKAGTVIERGQSLFSVQNRPVPLLYGGLPAWRPFMEGMGDGPDVRQLEENLVALGHATPSQLTVDETFTAATTAAVKRWQKASGVEETGVVEPGQAVFLPGALRVGDVTAEVGAAAPPGSPVLTGTSTTRVVAVALDATKQSLVKAGDKVEIELPDGRTTPGTVAEVGTVARATGQGDSAERVVDVSIGLDDPAATGTLDQAPVTVGITADSRTGVLVVPVNALLALAEGGYGVRVLDPAVPGGRIVAVSTGLFAKGQVEVSGDGLAEGTEVEVPAS
jgi:peptidoglycan hydrolase-like protein with peptidoglycan-binding domain